MSLLLTQDTHVASLHWVQHLDNLVASCTHSHKNDESNPTLQPVWTSLPDSSTKPKRERQDHRNQEERGTWKEGKKKKDQRSKKRGRKKEKQDTTFSRKCGLQKVSHLKLRSPFNNHLEDLKGQYPNRIFFDAKQTFGSYKLWRVSFSHRKNHATIELRNSEEVEVI